MFYGCTYHVARIYDPYISPYPNPRAWKYVDDARFMTA